MEIFTKTIIKIGVALFFSAVTINNNSTLYAQPLIINAGNGVTAAQIVDSLFDSNFIISNVIETANPLSRGLFTNNGSNLGLNSGVILCTGRAADAAGPNNMVYGANTAFSNNATPDPDLLGISSPGAVLKDLCRIEFDIVPYTDTLELNYCFGSEEYLTYAPPVDMSGAYNDVFGFFISGPGITGSQNIAVIPGTNTKISVYTINPLFNTLYFVNNLVNLLLGIITPNSIQYNGYTKTMCAKIAVVQGSTYHVKLAIADMRDNIVDSGVFIKAGSTKPGPAILPVSLIDWSAKNKGLTNTLSWKTNLEVNNKEFTIERSYDNQAFQPIANIKGRGNSSTISNYNYTDAITNEGEFYYRLKQTDYNGKFAYSPVIVLLVNNSPPAVSVEAYPIPANGNLNVQLQTMEESSGTIEIIDAAGRTVFMQQITIQQGYNQFQCNLAQLPHGAYFLKINGTDAPPKRIFN